MKKIFKKNQIIITALALMIAIAGYLRYTGNEISDDSAAQQASSDLSGDTYEISDEDVFQVEDIFTDTEDNSQTAATDGTVTDGTVADGAATDGTTVADGTAATDGATVVDGTAATDGVTVADGTATEGADDIENPGEAILTSSNVENLNFAAEVKLNREQVRSKNKETLLGIINNAGITEAQKQEAVDAMIRMTDVSEREAAAEMMLEAKGFTNVVVSITDDKADVVLSMGDVTDAKRAQVEDIVKRKTNVAAENIVITPIQLAAETATE